MKTKRRIAIQYSGIMTIVLLACLMGECQGLPRYIVAGLLALVYSITIDILTTP